MRLTQSVTLFDGEHAGANGVNLNVIADLLYVDAHVAVTRSNDHRREPDGERSGDEAHLPPPVAVDHVLNATGRATRPRNPRLGCEVDLAVHGSSSDRIDNVRHAVTGDGKNDVVAVNGEPIQGSPWPPAITAGGRRTSPDSAARPGRLTIHGTMLDDRGQLDPTQVTVVAAMENEARPVRRLVPQLRLLRAGIGLAEMGEPPTTPVAFSVGLAGGFDPDLAPGTVVIPREVAREDGVMLACDVPWSAALERASIRLGFPTVTLPMLSAAALVTHAGRAAWFAKGFAAVDMETALLARMVPRVAAVRVIFDTPVHEISPAWVNPRRAAADPRNWRETAWLARWVPRCTRRAAQVIAAALEDAR